MEREFSFINPLYNEIFLEEQLKEESSVFYFIDILDIEGVKGKITGSWINQKNEEFLCFDNGEKVRVDRIITINGIPGPAYDEYDRYGLACLDCSGGME